MTPDDLFAFLKTLGIETETHHHPAVATVEAALEHWADIPGVHCKNLFFKDAKGVYWLVVVPFDRDLTIKTLHRAIGSKRLSFASADRLREVLAIEPGAVTPLALVNDTEKRVNLVLDAWMMDQELLAFHPLVNTMTSTLTPADLRKFMAAIGHEPAIVALENQAFA